MQSEGASPPASPGSGKLWSVFEESVREFSVRPAIATARGANSFQAVRSAAEMLADEFDGNGITRGSIVALALPNSPDFVPALLAAWKCSATVALVSPKYRMSELRAIHDALHPACYVTDIADDGLGNELSTIIATPKVISADGALKMVLSRKRNGHPPTISSDENSDIALIKLTSGSTGVPKGVGLSVAQILAEARNIVKTLDLTPNDRTFAPVPMVHSYGFDLGVLPMIVAGVSLTVTDLFVPRLILSELARGEISVFLGVPSMYRTLVDIPLSSPPNLSQLRYLLSCTAPLRPDVIAAFHERFGAVICQHYGSSETGAVATHVPSLVLRSPRAVGRAMAGVSISVVDDVGRSLPHGTEGEVVIESEAVASGYVMGAPPGDSSFGQDGYRTGDLGVLDGEGLLHLTGRKGDLINVGGLKVSPAEVSEVLERCPAVKEAVVVGVPNDTGDEIVCAVVTPRTPTTAEEIITYCRKRLADYKVPRRVHIRDALPRGATGKVKLRAEDLGL